MGFIVRPRNRGIRFWPLVAATYFMVSGGPYAIEDILGGAGLTRSICILVLLPIVWSLPVSLLIGELASAIPADGGFYVWVRRAMGSFWGYQESWLSLSASIFDMAIYPTFAVSYLGRLSPELTVGSRGYMWSVAIVVLCCAWNLLGAPTVSNGSLGLGALLLSPFAVMVVIGFWRGTAAHLPAHSGEMRAADAISTAILVAMWNYMGWDNASTVAGEVQNPQRTYPRAMVTATAVVTLSYILPLVAVGVAGMSIGGFQTGDWTTAAATMGGRWLGLAVAAGGVATGIGMFNALVMSYSRLPMAMAEEGMLPAFIARRNSRAVPWISVALCGIGWALALNLKFERLISIDLTLYGLSLLLEFLALVILRIREPNMDRPFKAGNLLFACSLGIGPAVLIGYALFVSRGEQITVLHNSISSLSFSMAVALLGPLLYWLTAVKLGRGRLAAESTPD